MVTMGLLVKRVRHNAHTAQTSITHNSCAPYLFHAYSVVCDLFLSFASQENIQLEM